MFSAYSFRLLRLMTVTVAAVVLVAVLPRSCPARSMTTQEISEGIETWFADLSALFDEIADAPAVKRTSLAETDRYFVSALRRHQALNTLIKTNSRGVVISEVIRGRKPERTFRDISKQQWYSRVARTHQAYHGLLREDNGRYYLFWSKPVLRGSNRRFVGTVVAKIDLWDSFHAYAANVIEPFLVRMDGRSLYSNKWKSEWEYNEEELSIPGIERISVRSSVTGVLAQDPQEPQPSHLEGGGGESELVAEEISAPVTVGTLLSNRTFLAIAAVSLLIILVFAVRLAVQLNHYRLIRRVDRSDIL